MTYTRTIDNSQDILDSRDIIARIEELQSDREDWYTVEPEEEGTADFPAPIDDSANDFPDQDELDALLALQTELEGYCEWEDGATLIREDHFEDYARQYAEDIGSITGGEGWPLNCIDWEQAARELRYDYTSGDYDGITYYVQQS